MALALIESLAMTIGFGNSGLIPDMNFRIEDYRQNALESGAVEVAFSARELLPDGESPVADPWRFVVYSPDQVEIHLDDALIAGSTVTVFKGTLHPIAKK